MEINELTLRYLERERRRLDGLSMLERVALFESVQKLVERMLGPRMREAKDGQRSLREIWRELAVSGPRGDGDRPA